MTVLSEAVLEFVPVPALRRAVEREGRLVVVCGFADGLDLCRGLRMLAQRHPAVRFVLPGRVSHGCIRLRNDDIRTLVRLMSVGTPLTIT